MCEKNYAPHIRSEKSFIRDLLCKSKTVSFAHTGLNSQKKTCMHFYTQVFKFKLSIKKTCVTLKLVTHAHRIAVAKTIVVHFFHLFVTLL